MQFYPERELMSSLSDSSIEEMVAICSGLATYLSMHDFK